MSLTRKNLLLWVVVISLSVNLFFIGAVIARVLNTRDSPVAPISMRWVMRDMEPQAREQLSPLIRAQNEQMRPVRMQMFLAQREVNQLLAADPVDETAILEAFARLREANLLFQQMSHEQLTSIFSQLTPEQRQQAFRFISERRNPNDGGGRPGSGPGSRPGSGPGSSPGSGPDRQ